MGLVYSVTRIMRDGISLHMLRAKAIDSLPTANSLEYFQFLSDLTDYESS